MKQRRLKMLQNMPIFGGIREEILENIVAMAEIVTVPQGGYFFCENDPGTAMFVLEQGTVAVLKSWKGREYVLTELHTGDCFGEMALIDFGARTAAVFALEACSALKLSNTDMLNIYRKDLEQFTLIQMNIGREICRRLRKMDSLLFQVRVEAHTLHEHCCLDKDDPQEV